MDTVLDMQRRLKQRHHLLMHNVLLFLCVLLSVPLCPGHVSASLHRQHSVLQDLQCQMTHEQWLLSFRMSLEDIQDFYHLIAKDLHRDPVMACNSAGTGIQPECRLLMVLWWCAGASYLDLMIIFWVSKAHFFDSGRSSKAWLLYCP